MKIYKTHINSLKRWRQTYLRFLCPSEFFYYGWIVAGGSLRNVIRRDEPIRDVDIYRIHPKFDFSLDIPRANFIKSTGPTVLINRHCSDFKIINENIWEAKWKDKQLQIITPNRALNENSVIESFDFHAVCLAFDGEYLYWTRKAIRDLRKREISIQKLGNPVKTLERLARYHKDYGYKIHNAHKYIVKNLAPDRIWAKDSYFL